jgi:asparagine synthase (glutamine-hydrolysing)
MCGIAGYLSLDGGPAPASLVEAMTRALAHRGPDGEGFHVDGPVGLGHRRLAIIDLSPHGAQPKSTADGRVWITYNGEIFNFQDVRRELEARRHHFRTRSDTEVILTAYLEWGRACLHRLNGMFALALWDGRTRELWLARDRFGVKPLFYAWTPHALTFASEIKGLLPALPAPALDEEALHHFLSLNYTPAPRTLFRGVSQLPPGHQLVVRADGDVRVDRWWELEPAAAPTDAVAEVEALVDDAVTRRLLSSDVEVGAFLSSGVDSSVVVAAMARRAPQRVRTFTARFAERGYDEEAAAAHAAVALGTLHTPAPVGDSDLEALPDIVRHSEELTADSSMLAVYALARRASRDVKVVLTGDGADEVFGGYPTYFATSLAGAYRRVPRPVRERVVRPAVARLPVSDAKASLESRLRRFVGADPKSAADAHAAWRVIFTEEEKRRLFTEPDGAFAPTASLYEPYLTRAAAWDPVNRLLYADLAFYLPNDMLVKVDRMTMAWGLEARTPYLDYRLVELLAALPSRVKCGRWGTRPKVLLRRVARRMLPPEVRPGPKAGFNLPIARWLREDRRELVRRHLLDAKPGVLAIFTRAEIERLVHDHARGGADHSHKLWGLLCLSLWWQTFMEGAA